MTTFNHIKFGDNLVVTDEGSGVIRVDASGSLSGAGSGMSAIYKLLAEQDTPNQGSVGPDALVLEWAAVADTPGSIEFDTGSTTAVALLVAGRYEIILNAVTYSFNANEYTAAPAILFAEIGVNANYAARATFCTSDNLDAFAENGPFIGLTVARSLTVDDTVGEFGTGALVTARVWNYDTSDKNMINAVRVETRLTVQRIGDV